MPSLETEFAGICAAMQAVASPSPQISRAIKTKERLERQIKTYFAQVAEAVKVYNMSRRQIVIDWAIANGFGYCSIGKHFAALDCLEGVIKSGAYVSSGYYETLHDFQQRDTACPDHRRGLRSGPGRYEGEYSSYATYELKDPAQSLEAIDEDDYRLNKLAALHGITLPARASTTGDFYWADVTIGEVTLKQMKD